MRFRIDKPYLIVGASIYIVVVILMLALDLNLKKGAIEGSWFLPLILYFSAFFFIINVLLYFILRGKNKDASNSAALSCGLPIIGSLIAWIIALIL